MAILYHFYLNNSNNNNNDNNNYGDDNNILVFSICHLGARLSGPESDFVTLTPAYSETKRHCASITLQHASRPLRWPLVLPGIVLIDSRNRLREVFWRRA